MDDSPQRDPETFLSLLKYSIDKVRFNWLQSFCFNLRNTKLFNMSAEKLIPTLRNSMGTSYGCSVFGNHLKKSEVGNSHWFHTAVSRTKPPCFAKIRREGDLTDPPSLNQQAQDNWRASVFTFHTLSAGYLHLKQVLNYFCCLYCEKPWR